MNAKGLKILVTGLPGSGKTTLVAGLLERLPDKSGIAGFITREIREKGTRLGFELMSPDGRGAVLSHVEFKTPYRVGKYRVDLARFENFLESVRFFTPETRLVVIDEIGKMECLSEKFREIVLRLVSAPGHLLATIAWRGTPFIERIKSSPGTQLFELTPANRNGLQSELLEKITNLLGPI
ncbi:MAG: nucleoside-triphosphatase [Candidatus Saccharicenans sp.]|jgi:nucleoside-triphosphatase|nr:AAA family ATPase [Candidatus Saccharicenans sp.]MDH7574544.1 nucleoside-triphosphatase [Candidatus Saccharicenans sp.]